MQRGESDPQQSEDFKRPSPEQVDTAALLPVIRVVKEIRSFRRRIKTGVAIYRDRLVIFKPPRRPKPLSEDVYLDDGAANLAKIPGVRVIKVLPLEDIQSVEIWKKGRVVHFATFSANSKSRWKLPAAESSCVIEALTSFLGNRVKCSFDPAKNLKAPKPGITGVIVAIILTASAIGTLAWMWPHPGQSESAQWFLSSNGSGLMLIIIGGLSYLLARLADAKLGRKAGKEPFRSRGLSIALRVIGVGILVMQYLYPTYLLEWMFGSLQTGTIPNALANFSLGYFKGNLMVNACAMASLCCLYLAYRLGQGGAKHVMRTDKRAPVLFLRSFGDDGKHNLNPKGLIAVLLGARPFALEKLGPYANVAPTRLWKLITGSAVDNAEEQLGSFFRKIGPFVAIGRPGEMLSQGGADRLYVEHSEWQSKVLKFMEESAIVVLQPAETEGVWWEIEQAIKNVSPRRLLVSLACYEDSQEGWDRFRLRLEKLIGKPVPRARAGALFLHFAEDWTPTLLPVFYRTPFVWPVFGLAIDLRRTLEPFLEGFSPSTPARRPATGRRMPSMLTGIPAVALWWIGFIVVGQWIFVLSYHRKALQNATRGPVKEWTAESLPFVWRLGPHWDLLGTRELPQPLANFGTENRSVVAIWQMLGPGDIGEERLLAFVQRMEAAQSRNGAPIVRRAWIERGKHRWLEAEIRTRNVPKNMLALIRCYSGPEGDMAITAATDVIAQPTVGPARKALSAVLDAFELLDRPQLAAKLSVNKEKVNLFALQRYLATGDTNSAITVCLNMLKVNPNLIVVRENLADLYLGRENLKAANEQLQEIIRSKPDHARVYYILGLIAYEEKRFVQALENYRQALRLAPESEQVRLEIAATHLALENPREAIDVLQKGRQKHQPSFTGEFRTGLAYARLKEYTNALYHFIAAETIAQTAETNRLSRKLYFELGTTSDRVGKTAESIGYLEKCLSLSSNYAPALNYLGYLWANQGTNLARAQELLEQAVKLDPTEAAYLDSLGWVLFKQGHREKALELIQTAVRLNDDPDASIYEHLGDVLTALGKHAPAREAWRRSLALEPDENVEKKLKEASPP